MARSFARPCAKSPAAEGRRRHLHNRPRSLLGAGRARPQPRRRRAERSLGGGGGVLGLLLELAGGLLVLFTDLVELPHVLEELGAALERDEKLGLLAVAPVVGGLNCDGLGSDLLESRVVVPTSPLRVTHHCFRAKEIPPSLQICFRASPPGNRPRSHFKIVAIARGARTTLFGFPQSATTRWQSLLLFWQERSGHGRGRRRRARKLDEGCRVGGETYLTRFSEAMTDVETAFPRACSSMVSCDSRYFLPRKT